MRLTGWSEPDHSSDPHCCIWLFSPSTIYYRWSNTNLMLTHNGNHENGHQEILRHWNTAARWEGITRLYTPEDVERLRGSITIEYTLARLGAERLWNLLHTEPYIPAPGRPHRQPGRAAGTGRIEGDLCQRLAGGRRC